MTGPSPVEGVPWFAEPTRYDEAVIDAQSDQIDALRTRIGDHGSLVNLVHNVRNRYLAFPDATFTGADVRTLVEAFLAELKTAEALSRG